MKLTDEDWVASPTILKYSKDDVDEAMRHLILNRHDIDLIGYVCDAEASYSYDDYALIRLHGQYYLLATSGCSCPSPDETWGVVMGPCPLDEIEAHLKDEAGEQGYGVTKRQYDEFMALVAEARKAS